MTCVVVNDASCLIDLRKGSLLHVLCRLPYRFVVPLPIRVSELLDFTDQEWAILDDGGMETYDLPSEKVGDAFTLKRKHGRLSANDCFCLVATQCHEDGILLTGDRLLRSVAETAGVQVHGVLWVVDQLKTGDLCENSLLISALETWKADKSVFIPDKLIDRLLRDFH